VLLEPAGKHESPANLAERRRCRTQQRKPDRSSGEFTLTPNSAIAAAQGDQESKARIDAIATQLSADDLAAAQKAAQSFKPASMQSAANDIPKEALIIAQ
jgi:hypothetical protein